MASAQVQDPYIWDVQNDTLASTSTSSSSFAAEAAAAAAAAFEADGDAEAVLIPFSRAETAFAAVCAIIFTVVGIAGNLLTVVALLRCPKLRSHATTLFVISLAASDLLFCAVNLPLTAARYIHREWTLGPVTCRLFPFFFYGNVAASLMNMVAITVNRYVLISCHANYGRIYSQTNIFLMIAFAWSFSFGILVPPLAEVWGTFGLKEKTFSCTILRKDGNSPKKFLMMFAFLMPCIVIICCYSAIFFKVRQSRRNVQQHMNGNGGGGAKAAVSASAAQLANQTSHQSAQRREDLRLTKMMLTIFLCFLVCYLPLMLVNVIDDDEVRFPVLHTFASILAWMSAVVNPFIYAFKNRQYQQAFTKIICPLIPERYKSDSGVGAGGRGPACTPQGQPPGAHPRMRLQSGLLPRGADFNANRRLVPRDSCAAGGCGSGYGSSGGGGAGNRTQLGHHLMVTSDRATPSTTTTKTTSTTTGLLGSTSGSPPPGSARPAANDSP